MKLVHPYLSDSSVSGSPNVHVQSSASASPAQIGGSGSGDDPGAENVTKASFASTVEDSYCVQQSFKSFSDKYNSKDLSYEPDESEVLEGLHELGVNIAQENVTDTLNITNVELEDEGEDEKYYFSKLYMITRLEQISKIFWSKRFCYKIFVYTNFITHDIITYYSVQYSTVKQDFQYGNFIKLFDVVNARDFHIIITYRLIPYDRVLITMRYMSYCVVMQ